MKAVTIFKLKNGSTIKVEAEGKNLLQCSAAAVMEFISRYAMGMNPMDVVGVQTGPGRFIDGLIKEEFIARLIRVGWKENEAKAEYDRRVAESAEEEWVGKQARQRYND